MRLSDYSSNVYSQSGEDGMITEVFRRIGPGDKICVEFGANDGLSCSNTANLWKLQGWRAFLIEANPDLMPQLSAQATVTCTVLNTAVTAGGETCIDALLAADGFESVDLMSIDVDGDDFWIFCPMKVRPRLLVIEYNRTVPPHLDLQPTGPGNCFGIGALTLTEAAETRGYTLIGLSLSNLFFVRTEDAVHFADLERGLDALLPPEAFMYLVTDYQGRIIPAGAAPAWGLSWPPSTVAFRENQQGLLSIDPDGVMERLLRQVEKLDHTIAALTQLRTAVQELVAKEESIGE